MVPVPMATMNYLCRIAVVLLGLNGITAFQPIAPITTATTTTAAISHHATHYNQKQCTRIVQLNESASSSSSSSSSNDVNTTSDNDNDNELSNMATARFPTSPEDQARQASIAISAASQDGTKKHSVRLLLPIIGATELDDWPGGARQMMEAASPMLKDVLQLLENNNNQSNQEDSATSASTSSSLSLSPFTIQESVIDQSDGVRALFSQANDPINDACAILLPSADTIPKLQELSDQVGSKRNFILVNSQWRRRSDFSGDVGFGSFFGGGGKSSSKDEKIEFVENFAPTFHCSNVMVEGDIVRILRTYPGPWRVYLRTVDEEDEMKIDWVEIGTKDVLQAKTSEWEVNAKDVGDYDGGKLFDYGIPSYKDIEEMIVSRDGYMPKSLSERAAAAFTFIKDTL